MVSLDISGEIFIANPSKCLKTEYSGERKGFIRSYPSVKDFSEIILTEDNTHPVLTLKIIIITSRKRFDSWHFRDKESQPESY